MKFNLDNYVPVSERLQVFWKEHKGEQGTKIETEIVHLDEALIKNRMVVIKASIYVNNELASTGLAKEREGFAGANQTAFLENCETSAVGRALANYGILVERSVASQDEIKRVQAISDQHAEILSQIKTLALESEDKNLQQQVKDKWADIKIDPVQAQEVLDTLEVEIEVAVANETSEE
jgi:hypothetical protein